MRLIASILSVLVSLFLYRNGRTLNNLLVPAQLPIAYFAGGDADAKCDIIRENSGQMSLCEDIVFWDISNGGVQDRRLLVSCDRSRFSWNTVMGPLQDPSSRGSLWIVAPNSKVAPAKIELENFPEESDFHPLGVGLFRQSPDADIWNLLVVNHGRHNSTIEQFSLSPTLPYRALYISTLTSPEFVAPNSVAFTSPSSFYVTNDHRFTRRLPGLIGKILPVLESMVLPGLSWVNHVTIKADGRMDVVRVAGNVPFSNGIAISRDGLKVAVASSSGGQVRIYNRTDDNSLSFDTSVALPFAPDNIGFEDDGRLLVAGHPDFIKLIQVADQKRLTAPSWVVSIQARDEVLEPKSQKSYDLVAPYPAFKRAPISPSYEVTTLYQSNGTGFSTSATSLWDDKSKALYTVGVYSEGILACQG
ncbi:hypothetical protein BU17DRAFT_76882 [Hysterangium stoloniferum]|nr:hypothetical protein BU17DRAFT_76882 [Hysterangium stoloniferum]